MLDLKITEKFKLIISVYFINADQCLPNNSSAKRTQYFVSNKSTQRTFTTLPTGVAKMTTATGPGGVPHPNTPP